MPICKCIVRTAVIGGLATGAVVLLAGPDRVVALFDKARDMVVDEIDAHIEDPYVLRKQLASMKGEYPDRIAELAGELQVVERQIADLAKEREVSTGIAELAREDLKELEATITKAEDVREQKPGRTVMIRFEHERLPLDRAYEEATALQRLAATHNQIAGESDRELGFLKDQRTRMRELLDKLRGEQEQVNAQLAQIDAQIASIERNDELLTMMEQREKTIEELGRFENVSLEQFRTKLAKIRAEQQERLNSVVSKDRASSYEARVRARLQRDEAAKAEYEETKRTLEESGSDPVEVAPTEEEAEEDPAPVALNNGDVYIR